MENESATAILSGLNRPQAYAEERSKDLENLVTLLQAERIHRKALEDVLRESEKRVRFLAAQCLAAQEAERKRIAGELHDSIAATLTVVKFSIEKTIGLMEQGAVTAGSFKDLVPIVGQAIGEVRRIMADLRPSVLDDLGIVATLSWFCREWQKTYSDICMEKHVEISEREIPDSLKAVIYRISQEALNNIAKHSKACQVFFSLRKGRRSIELTVRDNGHGVDLDHVRRGLGLSTMRERAEYSGGSFDIESAVGRGTTIRVSWPIDP
jgi:signal transduction histidine kinase